MNPVARSDLNYSFNPYIQSFKSLADIQKSDPLEPGDIMMIWCQDIGELTSPLFDVASEKQKAALYGNPSNSIHLSIPCGDCPSENASKILQKWKEEGCIQRDPAPAIYVYYQYFSLPGDPCQYCRKGFICKIRIYDWEENVILRHENTMPGSVDEQVELLAATRLNASPTHGLYTDRGI